MLSVSTSLSPPPKIICFADDKSLLFKVDKSNALNDIAVINSHLEIITDTLDQLRLSVNVTKTQVVVFRTKQTCGLIPEGSIKIRGAQVSFSHTAKCLGVVLDAGLTWSHHITDTCSKLSIITGICIDFGRPDSR